MNAKSHAISVVMPIYNASPYLAEALDSILSQSFGDFELIAIDDGSTDRSREILFEYAAQDTRIRVIFQGNRGVAAALNWGIELAQGEYIARMDGDDVAWPERFAKQFALLERHPKVVALGTQFRLIDPDGRALKQLVVPQDHDSIDRGNLEKQSLGLCHPSAMIRARALREVGGYNTDISYAQDMDLWLRLAECGELANLGEVLIDYRMHLTSIGATHRSAQVESAYQAARAAARRRGLPETVVKLPAVQTPTRTERLRTWGWWALEGGNVSTARHYARRALVTGPLSPESWRLALMSLRGY